LVEEKINSHEPNFGLTERWHIPAPGGTHHGTRITKSPSKVDIFSVKLSSITVKPYILKSLVEENFDLLEPNVGLTETWHTRHPYHNFLEQSWYFPGQVEFHHRKTIHFKEFGRRRFWFAPRDGTRIQNYQSKLIFSRASWVIIRQIIHFKDFGRIKVWFAQANRLFTETWHPVSKFRPDQIAISMKKHLIHF
jgi:hypothetical protein